MAYALLFALPMGAQDLSGRWTGELVQGRGSWFFMEMDLEAMGPGEVGGISYIVLPSRPRYYAIMPVVGILDDPRPLPRPRLTKSSREKRVSFKLRNVCARCRSRSGW